MREQFILIGVDHNGEIHYHTGERCYSLHYVDAIIYSTREDAEAEAEAIREEFLMRDGKPCKAFVKVLIEKV